jgi:hypothetical protein
MTNNDINVVWVCTQCNQNFLFYSDVLDHKTATGHSNQIYKFDLLSGRMIDKIEIG